MQLTVRIFLYAITMYSLVFWPGAFPQAEAATNTNEGSTAPANATEKKDIVAMVNGTAITRKQFDNAMDYQLELVAMQGGKLSNAQLSDLKYEMLESLIGDELLYQESRKSGIRVEKKEIDDAYAERKQKAQYETDAEFEEALKKLDKSMASYRAEIELGLAIDKLIKKKITDTVVIPDSDAKQYYDRNIGLFQVPAQVRVSHIMVRVASDADQSKKEEATQRLEQVLKRLAAGEDFEALAKEVSEDGNTKDKGGDLGYISKGMVQASFDTAAFALEKGGISGIVQTSAGYHILKVTDKTEARSVSFEDAKSDIAGRLKSDRVDTMVGSYIKDLKNRSTILKYPIIK